MAMSALRTNEYYAPEVMSDETRNLYLIALHPKYQRAGIGSELVSNVEDALIQQGRWLLLVETSSLPKFEATKLCYRKCGFHQDERSQSSAVLERIRLCYGN
jgi:ribosomal protein S18 acetylase RimI-like enzyme